MLIHFILHVIYVIIVWYVVASLENTNILELGLDNINSNIHQDPRSHCFNVLTVTCPCLHFLIRRLTCPWKKSAHKLAVEICFIPLTWVLNSNMQIAWGALKTRKRQGNPALWSWHSCEEWERQTVVMKQMVSKEIRPVVCRKECGEYFI